MMRRMTPLTPIVLLGCAALSFAVAMEPATAPSTPTTQAATKPASELEGVWVVASAELAGTPLPPEMTSTITLTITGDAYTVTLGDTVDKGTLKVDSSAVPKTIDITGADGPNKGKVIPCIYEKSGDTLTICYNLAGPERPTQFATAQGTMHMLARYTLKK